MAYRWRQDGPAFEFPTPFGTENRFRTWRGWVLILGSLLVLGITAFVAPDESAAGALSSVVEASSDIALENAPENIQVPGSGWPHVLISLLLAVWGGMDLWQVSRQRQLLLAPGQPSSLGQEVSREGSGASPAAGAIMQMLSRGMPSPGELQRPYLRALRLLGPDLASAPSTLHAYLRARLSHLVLAVGLLPLASLLLLWPQPPATPLAAAWLIAVAVGGLLVHALHPERPALTPVAVGGLLAGAWLPGLALLFFSGGWPLVDKLVRFQMPLAAVALLGLAILLETLGVAAARAQVTTPSAGRSGHDDATASFDAHPMQLLREIDRELGRRWSEGVPNRRYAWQPPKIEGNADSGTFTALILEESQPATPTAARNVAPRPLAAGWLLVLDVLGLLLTLAAVAGLALATWTHMFDAASSWRPAALGLVAMAAGGWAMRVAHFLWSRTEVESTFTWLDLRGTWFRLPAGATPEAAGRHRDEAPLGVDELSLRSTVLQARSVFYAAGTWELGSRTVLSLAAHPPGAAVWTTLLQDFARKSQASPAATAPAVLAARAQARQRREAEQREQAAAPRKPARFCPACGTPVLAGARFCQQCGNTLD